MFEFKSIICVKMAQRTSANLIRVLYNLSREHDSHKRKSLLNAGLIEMIKWFSLAARKIVQGKMKLPKQTQKFMDRHQVHISIKGDTGENVPFISGKTLVKLHFRQKE